VDQAKLGVLKEADVARPARWVEGTRCREEPLPVRPDLPADAKPGERPYVVSGRAQGSTQPPQVPFDKPARVDRYCPSARWRRRSRPRSRTPALAQATGEAPLRPRKGEATSFCARPRRSPSWAR
jgi:hypothetical protein